MRSLEIGLSVLASLVLWSLARAPGASAQGVSLELAGGYDQLTSDLGYGEFEWPVLQYGNWSTTRTGRLGIDGRVAFSVGERWEMGAALGLNRATVNLVHSDCGIVTECPNDKTLSSADYTELVSVLATGRFWPMGSPDQRLTARPLLGVHTGVLWHDNGLEAVDREFVVDGEFAGTAPNVGFPLGIDAGVGMAISENAYLLTYLTGQLLFAPTPNLEVPERDRSCGRRPHSGQGDPCMRTLQGDGLGFRLGLRIGIGIRL